MDSLAGKKVLVTGATGFVGSRLSEILAQREQATVTGIGRNLNRVSYLEDLGITMKAIDLVNTDELRDVIQNKDIIFHTAAALDADPEMAEAVNVIATEQLVKMAVDTGVSRFIHVSTVGVYDMEGREDVDESTPLALGHSSTYPRTKAEAEVRARSAAEQGGLALSIVRPSMIYGPGHGIWSEGMFKNILDGNPVFLGDGSAHFNPVYIDDVVDAMILCAKHPKAAGEAFNVSDGITTWRKFMNHYGQLCDKEPKGLPLPIARLMAFANKIPLVSTPIDRGFIEMANSYKKFPIEKASSYLGWEPKVSLEEGMQKTKEWLKQEVLSD